MEFFIALLVGCFFGWIGWEIYKAKFKGRYPKEVRNPFLKPVDPPEQGVLSPVTLPENLKHQIIQHTYHKAYDGDLWPEWVCKCGGRDWVPTSGWESLEQTQVEARKAGEAHVRNGNKAEELMAKTKDKFAW